MTTKSISITLAAVAAAVVATVACAGQLKGHPNLQKARTSLNSAYDWINEAQKENEFDLGGHAAKAENLISQAQRELVLAAETANNRN